MSGYNTDVTQRNRVAVALIVISAAPSLNIDFTSTIKSVWLWVRTLITTTNTEHPTIKNVYM